jgi:hypothetical protein
MTQDPLDHRGLLDQRDQTQPPSRTADRPARRTRSSVAEDRTAIDVAFSLEQDTWNGERYLQLSVADFRAPQA